MAEKRIKWTSQQARAIEARDSDVLVTASAGTGKTSVLSGRCVDIISDELLRGDVLSMLVLTFTNAAAEQMRTRIAEQLRAACARTGRRHLRLQLLLLGGADISTIHSFCKRLITEHFYELELDPMFRVIETDEAMLLKAQALEQAIDWAWGQSNLVETLQQLLYRRNLQPAGGFLSRIIDLSDYLDSVVWRDNWYERARLLAEAVEPLTGRLGERQRKIIADKLQQILNQIGYAQRLYKEQEPDGSWAQKWQEGFVETVAGCVKLSGAGDWVGCAEQIRSYRKPSNLQYKPNGLDGPIGQAIRDTADAAKKDFDALAALAVVNPDYLDRVAPAVRRQTALLLELVRRFEHFYSRAKRAVGCLDFADLEHYALRLLTDKSSTDEKLVPSDTALVLRKKYKYIFVDEYQDINSVQKAILDMLSSEANVFVVGDVKQSIYAFRGAEPKIFAGQLTKASAEPKDASDALRVDLNTNWRSKKGILDFVNRIFERIMKGGLADIDYDESAKLTPGDRQATDAEDVVELHILDQQSTDENRDDAAKADYDTASGKMGFISSRQRQAALIAQRIRRLVGADTGRAEFQIYDEQLKRPRDLEYADIVILMRSPAKRANEYAQVLQLAGVPVSCELGSGYFEATEVSDVLSLLKVLDNPCRDIELAAVLRSGFFALSDSELAEIKIRSVATEQVADFYDCITWYCSNGPDANLAERLEDILGSLERWRALARRGCLAELIWQIYRDSGLLSRVSALVNGRSRRGNLLKLHDRAIEFEGFVSTAAVPSLGRFVAFIEKLSETGRQWSGARPQSQGKNAVRIMSVHKAKGLEFSVVILAELDSSFSSRDFAGDCLIDSDGLLGLRIIDVGANARLDSIGYQVIEEQRKKTLLAEEMRILYVALTRARERLILTGCAKKNRCRKIISSGLLFGDGPVADWQLRRCRSHLDWILYALSSQQGLHRAFETTLAEKCSDDEASFALKVYGGAELEQLSEYINKLKLRKSAVSDRPGRISGPVAAEPELLAKVKENLAWQYRYAALASLPAKQSVAELTHRGDEYVRIDYSRALQRRPRAVLTAQTGLTEAVDARLLGTAAHLVISSLDLSKPVNQRSVESTLEKLVAKDSMNETLAQLIDVKSIVKFFETDLGTAALDSANTVYREWPFTFALAACEFSNLSRESRTTSHETRDTIIVQGIIDMLIKTPKGLIVIDFKTDNVTTEEIADRAGVYRAQLDYYGRAASTILKNKLLAKWLYFLTPGCATKVE